MTDTRCQAETESDGTPTFHGQVYNDEDTVSLAGNYWDRTNWETSVIADLRALIQSGASRGYRDPQKILAFLEDNNLLTAAAAAAWAKTGAVGTAEQLVEDLKTRLAAAQQSLLELRKRIHQVHNDDEAASRLDEPQDETWAAHRINLGM